MKKNDYSQHKVLADFEIPAVGVRYVVTGNVSMSPVEDSDLRTGKELLSGIIMSKKIDMVTKKEESMKMEKEMVTRYKQALYHAACDYSKTKNCSGCSCRNSCGCNPGTMGCRFALEDMWKRKAGIQ